MTNILLLTSLGSQVQEATQADLRVSTTNILYYKRSADCTLVYIHGRQEPLKVIETPEEIDNAIERNAGRVVPVNRPSDASEAATGKDYFGRRPADADFDGHGPFEVIRTNSRDGMTTELLGVTCRLTNPCAHFMFNPIRMSAPYAAAEFLWYMSAKSTVENLLPYAPKYERFLEADGTAYGAYGKRWLKDDQFQAVFRRLKEDPESRRIVLVNFEALDNSALVKDIPCTVSLQFIVRDKKLNVIANMRSNDLWLGFPYDVFCFTSLQILFAHLLGSEVGWYQHQAGSLHVYDRNLEKFTESVNNVPSFATGPMEYSRSGASYGQVLIERAINLEHWSRVNKTYNALTEEELGKGSLLAELVKMTACKWDFCKSVSKSISNKLMAKWVEEHHES